MTDQLDICNALTAAFEDVALSLGNAAAAYPVPDEALWELALDLDLVHERSCRRYRARAVAANENSDGDEHPAIVYLLSQLRSRGVAQSDGGPE